MVGDLVNRNECCGLPFLRPAPETLTVRAIKVVNTRPFVPNQARRHSEMQVAFQRKGAGARSRIAMSFIPTFTTLSGMRFTEAMTFLTMV